MVMQRLLDGRKLRSFSANAEEHLTQPRNRKTTRQNSSAMNNILNEDQLSMYGVCGSAVRLPPIPNASTGIPGIPNTEYRIPNAVITF